MKIELITEREFENLRVNVEPGKIKKRDGFCVATVGDTVYLYPEFDHRALLADVIVSSLVASINGRTIFGDDTREEKALARFLQDLGMDNATVRAAGNLFLYLAGLKFGKRLLDRKKVHESTEHLREMVIDNI